jgi:hypothetical protein
LPKPFYENFSFLPYIFIHFIGILYCNSRNIAHSIPTTSFYGSSTGRIRFSNNGMNVETRQTRVIFPDGDNSEVEDDEDGDEVENFDNMSGSNF